MPRWKLFIAMPLGALLLVSACSTPSSTSAANGSTAAKKLTSVTYINPVPGAPIWDALGDCMKKAGTAKGLEVKVVGPSTGGTLDIQGLGNLLSQAAATKTQAVALWTAGGAQAWDPIIKQIRDQGGVVASLYSGGATKNQNFDVGFDWGQWGRDTITFVAARPGQQNLGVIWQKETGPGYADYVAGLKDEATKHANVKLVSLQYDNGNFVDDLSIAKNMLTAHPEMNVIANYSGSAGVMTAIQEKNQVGKVYAVIGDDNPQATQGFIDKGLLAGVRVVDTCSAADKVVQGLLDAYAGKSVPANVPSASSYILPNEFKNRPGGSV